MESALMSGTPVPIYVRRKKLDTPKKSPFISIKEITIKPAKTPKPPKTVTPKPPKQPKPEKRRKISKSKPLLKVEEKKKNNRESDSSGPHPRSLTEDAHSRSSSIETYNTLWPLGVPIDTITRPVSSNASIYPTTTATASTVLLPPTPVAAQAPPRPPRSPTSPLPLEAIGDYPCRKRSQHASLLTNYSEPAVEEPYVQVYQEIVEAYQKEIEFTPAPLNPRFYEQQIKPLRPRTVSEPQVARPAPSMDHVYNQGPASSLNPAATFQHIQDMAAKRVSTLDYLRKTHEGRVYWFNTLLYSKSDISRLPSFEQKKLARRAQNFLILGLSLPMVLDLTTLSSLDFLKALNALLIEFETYQSIHPADGSNASSLSRARLPQMFKRSTTTKARRASSAADIGGPINGDGGDIKSIISTGSSSTGAASITSSEDLMPGEQYNYLITPSIPFDPDFFEVFASLCDVLIDCYMRITSLISSAEKCGPGIAEVFAKTDARLRKVIVAGIVKEFEDATRASVKAEINGISKVVLGGLM